MEIKTVMRCHFIPTHGHNLKRLNLNSNWRVTSVAKDMENLETLCTAGVMQSGLVAVEDSVLVPQKAKQGITIGLSNSTARYIPKTY